MVTTRNNKEVLHLNILFPILAVVLIVLVSGSARAQQCSEILQYGLYDVSRTSSQEDLIESYLQAISKQEIKTEQEARSLKLGVTLPTDVPTPAELGLTGNSSKSYGQALAEYIRKNTDYRRKFNQEFLSVNANIVAAWKDCAVNKKALVCWAEQTKNPSEILLKMELRPLTLTGPISIKEINYSPSVSTSKDFKGKRLPINNPFSIIFTRKGDMKNDAVNFTVETSDDDYSCNADAPSFSDPAIAPQERSFVLPVAGSPSSCADPRNTDHEIETNPNCTWLNLPLLPNGASSEFQISLRLTVGMTNTSLDGGGCSDPHRMAEVVLSCGNQQQRSGQLGRGNVDQWTQDYSLIAFCKSSGNPVNVKIAINPRGCTKVTLNSGELRFKEIRQ